MKLWDIVKTVGTGLLASNPAGAAIMGAVNLMLPDDEQLPVNATGEQVQNAIQSLPAADRARIMEKEIDVELTTIKESHSTVRTMLESDAANPHTTRPYIVKHSFHVIAVCSIVTIALWAYAVATGKDKMVKTIMDGWPFVVGILTPFVVLLRTYFGVIKQEHSDRLSAAGGSTPTPSGLAGLISMIKK